MSRNVRRCACITAVLLFVMLAAPVRAEVDAEKIERDVVSSWIVSVEGEARTRTLHITGTAHKQDGRLALDASYGWTDGRQSKVKAELTIEPGGYRLELITPPGSVIVANSSSAGVFTGTFTAKSGAVKPVTLQRISAQDLAKPRVKLSVAQPRGETVWIPMLDKGFFSTREIKLEATLYKPQGDGPFPVVIFNHGSTGPGAMPADLTINPSGYGAYLLKKGIALLIPMRRGRGKSEGTYQEPYDCSLHQSRVGINYAMESLDAVYTYLGKQPWADMEKIILSGVSRGGILSVVYAAERRGSAIGVLNFSGGWVGDSCNFRAPMDANAVIFKEAGAKSKVPNLFLYAANDWYFSISSIEKYPEAYREGGGAVEYKLYTLPAGVDGHSLFGHWRSWVPDANAFLAKLGVWKP